VKDDAVTRLQDRSILTGRPSVRCMAAEVGPFGYRSIPADKHQ
jgi:hypothetical protein